MRQFLLIQTAFIGDVILMTALVEKLRAYYPDAAIDVLVRKGNEGLLAHHPHLRRALVWRKQQGKYRHWLALLRQVRQQRYDVVVNLQRFAATGVLAAASGAEQVVGFAKNPVSRFFTHRLPHPFGDGTHEVARNLSLIAHLTDDLFVRPRLYPSAADEAAARAVAPDAAYICVAPASVWFTKQWPAARWKTLIERLRAQHPVLILGSLADAPLGNALVEEAGTGTHPVRNTAGQLGLLASAALMAKARMNYVNDSAPLHLASAVNAPVTAIFCSTVPRFGFTPLSDRAHVVEAAEPLACRPCGLHGYRACPRGHFRCADIGVDRVAATAHAEKP